jgi:hypothetical protein
MLNRVSVKRHRHRAARKVVNAYDVIARQAFKLRSQYADWLDEGPRDKRQSEQDAETMNFLNMCAPQMPNAMLSCACKRSLQRVRSN